MEPYIWKEQMGHKLDSVEVDEADLNGWGFWSGQVYQQTDVFPSHGNWVGPWSPSVWVFPCVHLAKAKKRNIRKGLGWKVYCAAGKKIWNGKTWALQRIGGLIPSGFTNRKSLVSWRFKNPQPCFDCIAHKGLRLLKAIVCVETSPIYRQPR